MRLVAKVEIRTKTGVVSQGSIFEADKTQARHLVHHGIAEVYVESVEKPAPKFTRRGAKPKTAAPGKE